MDNFREALRAIGAPDWFPQDAPKHTTNLEVEQNKKGERIHKFSCPKCGWERHFIGPEMLVVVEGDKWAFHSSCGDGSVEIMGLNIIQNDPNLDVFKKHLEELSDD